MHPDSAENSSNQRKSYQIRALVRSKLSYQKRQYRTNILCVALCPIMMVAIGGILGIVIHNLISDRFPRTSYVTCSNESSFDENNLPLFFFSKELLPNIPGNTLPHSLPNTDYYALNHYLLPFVIADSTNQVPRFSLSDNTPSCGWSYDKNYTYSSPYFINPNVNISARLDSTEKPDPKGGWFNIQVLATNQVKFYLNQKLPWMLVKDTPTHDAGFIKQTVPIQIPTSLIFSPETISGTSIQSFIESNQTQTTISSSNSSGLLKLLDKKLYLNFNQSSILGIPFIPSTLSPVPWYEPVDNNDSSLLSPFEVDDILSDYIRTTIKRFQQLDVSLFNSIRRGVSNNNDSPSLIYYFGNITPIVSDMPWGALLFDTVNPANKTWKYTIQIGNNDQISNAGSLPSVTQQQMTQQTLLGNGFLRSALNKIDANIVHTLRAMPQLYYFEFNIPFGSILGSSLYPFGISFMICIFVLILVKEKEDRILVMMQMNGLKYSYYYISHYIHFFILSIWTCFFFVLAGRLFNLELFTNTDIKIIILLMFLWSNAQISVAFFISSFFSRVRTSQLFVYLVVLWGVIVDAAISLIYTERAPIAYLIWPPFAMYRALSKLNVASISTERPSYKLSDIVPGDDLFLYIIALFLGWLVYLVLAIYLNMVLSTEYGTRKPWHFFISDIVKIFKSDNVDVYNMDTFDESELQFEDEDVKAERNRVILTGISNTDTLILNRLRKVYSSGKAAVKDVTLSIESGTIFGLLGPNGAGKTSIISIVTGLYKMTSGSANLAGFDVRTETDQVYRNFGICPQHDILWDDLSISEHLYFYARLKGTPKSQEDQLVTETIERVKLTSIRNRIARKLSGGEKRRLSIAISFVGNPSVVFLDEPTTGLDPEVRRVVWNIINENKLGKTIILTTHSMEEAEVLCNRIGIMAHGTMRCLGTPLRLKQKYGSGFLVSISANAAHLHLAKNFIESLLPDKHRIVDSHLNGASWEFIPYDGLIPNLYYEINDKKASYYIDNWSISQTSLDEVFLRIIGEDESSANE
ncbi:ABC transporter A family member 7 [Smittium culicis]|uniref:ABC transporter A family member 7 n=1 Tax=Smittium culicis TaxID=133412 RepID=A0A1R1XSI8_9FUNG|nr:ABC transporter A family member 7 [Smittium culicis]OMJ17509.1 ABC transporter A family member 7 [Smittium culicis]